MFASELSYSARKSSTERHYQAKEKSNDCAELVHFELFCRREDDRTTRETVTPVGPMLDEHMKTCDRL